MLFRVTSAGAESVNSTNWLLAIIGTSDGYMGNRVAGWVMHYPCFNIWGINNKKREQFSDHPIHWNSMPSRLLSYFINAVTPLWHLLIAKQLFPNLSVEPLHPGFMCICFFNRIPTLCANFEMIKKKVAFFSPLLPNRKIDWESTRESTMNLTFKSTR